MSVVEVNHYRALWWEKFGRELTRFDILMGCISGSKRVAREIVLLGIGDAQRDELV